MNYDDLSKFLKLVKKWREPVQQTADDPTYNQGQESARESCAEELEEMIKEIERNKWSNFLK